MLYQSFVADVFGCRLSPRDRVDIRWPWRLGQSVCSVKTASDECDVRNIARVDRAI